MESTSENIRFAGRVIAQGGLVAFPTETVFGLGADALNEEAVRNVYKAKGRPSDNPMIVHVAEARQLQQLTDQDMTLLEPLAKAFWPGPLTIVVQKKILVPDVTTGGLGTVAVRNPDNDIARELIMAAGAPIAAPSANLSGRPSPTKTQHVIADLKEKIDVILQGEDCRVGIESTVLDMSEGHPVILRPGIITKEQLENVLLRPVEIDPALIHDPKDRGDFRPKAPGMKYKHYAPKADMVLFQGEDDAVIRQIHRVKEAEEAKGRKVGIIFFSEGEYAKAAHDWFAQLRSLDQDGVDVILAKALSQKDQVGFAVMNRMLKSAGYHVEKV